jgi:hypothetical protein
MAFVMDFRSPDFLYDTVDIAIWSDTEQGLAVTAGSLATLRPLYRIIATKLGFSQPGASAPLSGGKRSKSNQGWYNSTPVNRPKRSGPFSLMTLTRNETRAGGEVEDAMENARPVKLRDASSSLDERERQEKSFASWTVRGGESSEEDLNAAGRQQHAMGGITRQTDVFLERSHLHHGGI